MNLKKFTHKQRGIGLLELMLSLAIIAILLVMATRYWIVSNSASQVNRAVAQLGAIQGALGQYRSGNSAVTVPALLTLNNMGLLSGMDYDPATQTISNPWGGPISITAGTAGKGWAAITIGNIPQDACLNLQNKYANDPNVDSSTSCAATGNTNKFVYDVK